jgi:hypothetical protein
MNRKELPTSNPSPSEDNDRKTEAARRAAEHSRAIAEKTRDYSLYEHAGADSNRSAPGRQLRALLCNNFPFMLNRSSINADIGCSALPVRPAIYLSKTLH